MSETAREVKRTGGGMTLFGVLTMVFGVLAISAPLLTGMSIALIVGILVLCAGAVRVIWAFKAESLGQGLLTFAIGGLTFVAGLAMVADPLLGAGVLTIVLAAYFLVDGVFEIAGAFQVKPESGWGWLLFGGIVSVLLGFALWRQFPLSGPWAVGVLLGIKLIMAGMIMITVGSTARSMAKRAT